MKFDDIKWEDREWGECLKAACDAYYDLDFDPTIGSNHYFNPAVVTPSWYDESKVMARIGSHVFLKL